jgi:hypothetical protein
MRERGGGKGDAREVRGRGGEEKDEGGWTVRKSTKTKLVVKEGNVITEF